MNIKPLKRNHFFIPSRFESKIENHFHSRYLLKRERLTNQSFSIISNSCVGASVYKDFGIKFFTPFIAVYIDPDDFVLMLKDLKKWLSYDVTQIDYPASFPVGLLGGKIFLFFVHENNFDEAVFKWRYRIERINWNNIFVILDPIKQTFKQNSVKSTCSVETIKSFFSLGYARSISFVSKKYQVVNQNCIFIKCYQKYAWAPYIGRILIPSGKRVYDKYFDMIRWLNENEP